MPKKNYTIKQKLRQNVMPQIGKLEQKAVSKQSSSTDMALSSIA
jgi:hypothetical protein